jgi:hypothetical protein
MHGQNNWYFLRVVFGRDGHLRFSERIGIARQKVVGFGRVVREPRLPVAVTGAHCRQEGDHENRHRQTFHRGLRS